MVKLLEQHGDAVDELISSYFNLPWYKRLFYPVQLARLIEHIASETQNNKYHIHQAWQIYQFFLTNHQVFQNRYFAIKRFTESPFFSALSLYHNNSKLNLDVFSILITHPYPNHLQDLLTCFCKTKCLNSHKSIQLLQLALIYQQKHPRQPIKHWIGDFEDLYLKNFYNSPFWLISNATNYCLSQVKQYLALLSSFKLNNHQWHALFVDWGQIQRILMLEIFHQAGLLDADIIKLVCDIQEPILALEYLEKLDDGGLMNHFMAKQIVFWLFDNNPDECYMQQAYEVLQTLHDASRLDVQFNDVGIKNILSAKQPLALLKAMLEPSSKIILDNPLYGKVFLELAILSNAPHQFISEIGLLNRLGALSTSTFNALLSFFLTTKSDVSSVSEALCFIYDSRLFFDEEFWVQFSKLEFPHVWSNYTNSLLLNFNLNAEDVILYSRFLMRAQHLNMHELYLILLDLKTNEKLFIDQKIALLNILFKATDHPKEFYDSLKILATHQIYPKDIENMDLSALASSSRQECVKALISLQSQDLNQPVFQSLILQCHQFSKLNHGCVYYHHMLSCLLLFKNMGLLNCFEQLHVTEFLSYNLGLQSKTMQDLLKLTHCESLVQELVKNHEYSPCFLDCAITLLKPILEQKLASYEFSNSSSIETRHKS